MRPTPLRTIADALVITAVVAFSMGFAASTDWPRWAHLFTLVPAAYLVSRLSGEKDLPWWKSVGFLGFLIFLSYLGSVPPEDRIIPPNYMFPVFFLFYLGYSWLKKQKV